MQSTVMLVDADGSPIRSVVERHIDPKRWAILQREDVERAWADATVKAPDLVVLNADVAKGWNLCAQLKRKFPSLPVVLLSYKANKELFNNHQKLPTRADAYHHLPDEIDGLGMSLSYFSSHHAETPPRDDDSPKKPRAAARVQVPSGMLNKLEGTVRDQARELEGMRRQIEALEAERDAVSEKARRQMDELMARAQGNAADANEVAALKKRVAELEGEAARSARLEDQARELQAALEDARTGAAGAKTSADAALAAARSEAERAKAAAAQELATLTGELASAHERRIAADALRKLTEERLSGALQQASARGPDDAWKAQLAQALERAAVAERAWSGVNARAEELLAALQGRGLEVERLSKEKSDVETALGMSRKLMKDYINEAARNAEAARKAGEHVKELEAKVAEVDRARASAQREVEEQRSRADSLERELQAARAAMADAGRGREDVMAANAKQVETLAAQARELEAAAQRYRDLEAQLATTEASRAQLRARLKTLADELTSGS